MIKYIIGDIFASPCQTLVNPVNCQGAMGKGLALQFKERFPEVNARYVQQCKAGKWKPGCIFPHKLEDGRIVLNVSTKDQWRLDSQIEWIESILTKIVQKWQEYGITSLAMTKLGCGNGNLEWSQVGPLIYKYLGHLPIEVEIYIEDLDIPYGIIEQAYKEQIEDRFCKYCDRPADKYGMCYICRGNPSEDIATLKSLKDLMECYDITTEVLGPGRKPLWLQLENRGEGFFCLWTQNREAIGWMEHEDCSIERGVGFDDLYLKLASDHDIKLDLIPLEKWETVQANPCLL